MNIYDSVAKKHDQCNKNQDSLAVKQQSQYVTLPYYGVMSIRIAGIFKKRNINIAFSTDNKVGSLLIHNIQKFNQHQESGVYRLSCSDCDAVYIGQTGRKLEIRFREHVALDRRDIADKSNFAAHLINSGHTPPDLTSQLKLLHRGNKGRYLDLLEEMEIFCNGRIPGCTLLNEQIAMKSTHFWEFFTSTLVWARLHCSRMAGKGQISLYISADAHTTYENNILLQAIVLFHML